VFERMIRAARLDAGFYEEIEHDPNRSREARRVVLLVAVVSGIGAGLLNAHYGLEGAIPAGILRAVALWLGWVAWAAVSEWLGTTLTAGEETHSTFAEMLRVLAYAQTPWLLGALVFLPVVGRWLFLASAVWALLAGIVAIRQACDFSTSRAVVTVVAGWIVMLAVIIVLLLLGVLVRIALGTLFG
jgi:hypothetical protein